MFTIFGIYRKTGACGRKEERVLIAAVGYLWEIYTVLFRARDQMPER
jgi:hypothetical protein